MSCTNAPFKQVAKDLWAAFSYPCEKNYGSRYWSVQCVEPNSDHGHLFLDCEDGVAYIAVCIYSRSFFHAVVEHLFQNRDVFSAEEMLGIQALVKTEKLP